MLDSFLAKLSTLEGPMPKQKEQASHWLYYKSGRVSKQPGLKQTDMIWYDMIWYDMIWYDIDMGVAYEEPKNQCCSY